MGTIAAREALRVCDLVGHALAVHLLVAAQACELRGGLPGRPAIQSIVAAIRELSPGLDDDRPLDGDIEAVYQSVVAGPLGLCVECGG
jgi:histidine ammonia-lyase